VAPSRRSQTERRQAAEERILEAALDLISEVGTTKMTLEDVGKRAGYSRGLPAHYFGNKEGLIVHLINDVIPRFRRLHFLGPRPRQGLARVIAGVDAFIRGASTETTTYKAFQILLSEAVAPQKNDVTRASLIATNEHALRSLEYHIKAGIEKGEIDPSINTRGAAIVILGAMRGTLEQFFLDPERYPVETWREQLLSIIGNALAI
jgi:AcrR family transcriptional regulator